MLYLPILGEREQMTLHETENAAKFDTKQECQAWIDDRIVRFKLRMMKAATQTPGEFTYVPKKEQGMIICKLNEDFKKSGTDEPLSNYAEPVKQEKTWLAIMRVQE
jgi:hypothetical protein